MKVNNAWVINGNNWERTIARKVNLRVENILNKTEKDLLKPEESDDIHTQTSDYSILKKGSYSALKGSVKTSSTIGLLVINNENCRKRLVVRVWGDQVGEGRVGDPMYSGRL